MNRKIALLLLFAIYSINVFADTLNICLANDEDAARITRIEYGKVTKVENKKSSVADNLLLPFAVKMIKDRVLKKGSNLIISKDNKNSSTLRCEDINRALHKNDDLFAAYKYDYKTAIDTNIFSITQEALTLTFGVIIFPYSNCKIYFYGETKVNRKKGETFDRLEARAVAKMMTNPNDYFVNTDGCGNN